MQRLTFLVVTYNSIETVAECIESILAQSVRPHEVFVVDNASTDGTQESVREDFPGVTIMKNENNLGYGAANNSAARAARGDLIAIVNPDVALDPNWSIEVTEAIENDPNCAAAEGKLLLADRPGFINCAGSSINLLGFGCMTHYAEPSTAANEERLVGYASGAAFAIRRDVFLSVGGFDESYFLYQEDVDLGFRLHEAGWQIRYAPRAIATHRYKSDLNAAKVRYLERNRWKTLAKHMPIRYFLLCAPLILSSEIGITTTLMRTGLLRPKVEATLDFIHDVTHTLESRRSIEKATRAPGAVLRILTGDFPPITTRTQAVAFHGERLMRRYYDAFLKKDLEPRVME